jgi:vitamin B12 transporter
MAKLIITVVLICLAQVVQVQNSSAQVSEVEAVKTVYVDAERISSQEIEASRSAVIFDEATINLKRPATVADILRDTPGIEVVRQGGVGQTTTVFIRGAKSESTLVLIDGIEVNDVMAPASGFDFSTLSASHIVRIEVYRGPQSVRFGAGALGGVINIITKEGRGPFGGEYFFEAGSFKTKRVAVAASARKGILGYSLAAEGFETDGFSAASREDGNYEKDSASFGSVSGKVVLSNNSTTRVESTLRYAQAEAELDRGGGSGADDPNNESSGDQLIAGLSGQTRFLNDQLLSTLGFYFGQNERDSENLADPSSTQTSKDHFKSENYKIEMGQELSVGDAHKIRFDLQWRGEKGEGESVFNGTPNNITEKDQAILGEAITYLYEDEKWFGDIGVRSDQPDELNDIISQRASFGRFLSSKNSKVYVSYGTGFKLPSLYQLYSSFGNKNLVVEESQTVEATLQTAFTSFDKSSVTVFNNTFRDMIDYDSGTNKYLNISKARSRGVELQSQVYPIAELGLKSSFTYLEAIDESTGLRLLRRPSRTISIEGEYKINRWISFAKCTYRSRRPHSDPVTFARMTNGSYSVVDVGVEYELSSRLSLKARVDNLFDKKYEEVAGYGTAGLSGYAGLQGRF